MGAHGRRHRSALQRATDHRARRLLRGPRRRAARRARRRGHPAQAAAARRAARRGAGRGRRLALRRPRADRRGAPGRARRGRSRTGRPRRRRGGLGALRVAGRPPVPDVLRLWPGPRPRRRALPLHRPRRRRALRGALDAAGVERRGDRRPRPHDDLRPDRPRALHGGDRGAGGGRRPARHPELARAPRGAQVPDGGGVVDDGRRAPRDRPVGVDRAGQAAVSREVRVGAGTDPIAGELIAAMVAEVEAMYGSAVAARPEDLSPPGGAYVTVWEDGRAVAGGGLLRLDDATCEIKRMYVVPEARGGGAGRELLEALEALGRERGYTRARLDTGAKQSRAQRIYERAGYRPVPDYNGNPLAAFWGEKA